MINQEIVDALNNQINLEFRSAYNYLGMSAHFEQQDLRGFAKWCLVQHQEELDHAMRLYNYLLDRGGSIVFEDIKAPRSSFSSTLEVFETALKQEQANTTSINELYEKASKLNDHATISHLQWFVDEQVEEESLITEAVSLVKRANDEAHAILYLNDKFGERSPESTEI